MRPLLSPALLFVLAACSGSAKHDTPPAGGGGSGDDATACESGRCLADISKQVSEHRTESRACFDSAAKKDPAIKPGRLIINFRIDKDGSVTEASQGMQDEQITDEGVISCVSDVIKKIKFASSPSGKATRAYHQFEFAK